MNLGIRLGRAMLLGAVIGVASAGWDIYRSLRVQVTDMSTVGAEASA